MNRRMILSSAALGTLTALSGCLTATADSQTAELESTVKLRIDGESDCILLINAKPGDNEQIFVQERTVGGEQSTHWFHNSTIADEKVRQGSRIVAFAVDLRSEQSVELARYKVTDDNELTETDYSVAMRAENSGKVDR